MTFDILFVQQVLRLRADLQREHERKLLETREASRRMKEDCEHQVLLERNKTKELEDYILRLKNQVFTPSVQLILIIGIM